MVEIGLSLSVFCTVVAGIQLTQMVLSFFHRRQTSASGRFHLAAEQQPSIGIGRPQASLRPAIWLVSFCIVACLLALLNR